MKKTILLFAIAALIVLSPITRAVVPAPDGCYPGFTTAEGCRAPGLLTTGAGNTAIGWYSLFSDTSGNYNTGLGAGALALNNADSNTATGTGALLSNTTGPANTANGAFALLSNTTGAGQHRQRIPGALLESGRCQQCGLWLRRALQQHRQLQHGLGLPDARL